MTGRHSLMRLARREAARRKGRTALVVALIALPVAILVVGSMFVHTAIETADDRRTAYGGQSHFVFSGEPVAGLDEVGAVAVHEIYSGALRGSLRRNSLVVTDVPLAEPITRGMLVMRSGRPPRTEDEVAVTPSVAKRLSIAVGDRIAIPVLDRTIRGIVTGTLVSPENLRGFVVLTGSPLAVSPAVATRWLVPDVPLPPDLAASTPDQFADTSGNQGEARAAVLIFGSVALMAVGLVIAAAFAVGARRQVRTIGLLAASGSSPAQVRAFVTLQGVVTGIVGSVVGLATGLVAIAVMAPHLDRMLNRLTGGVSLSAIDLAVVTSVAIAVSTLAAALPARSAARVPVLSALGGRRPLPRVPRRLPVAGIVTAAIGTFVVGLSGASLGRAVTAGFSEAGVQTSLTDHWVVAVIGAVLVLAGGVLCTPALVGALEGSAGRFRGVARLAARNLGRHRTRTGPLVGAVMAAGALAIAAATLTNSIDARENRRQVPLSGPDQVVLSAQATTAVDDVSNPARPVPPGVIAEVQDIIGPSTRGDFSSAGGLGFTSASDGIRNFVTSYAVGDGRALEALGGSRAAAAFAAGKAVALTTQPVRGGKVQVLTPAQSEVPNPPEIVEVASVQLTPPLPRTQLPDLLIPPAVADRLSLVGSQPASFTVLRATHALDHEQARALDALQVRLSEAAGRAFDRGELPVNVQISSGRGFRYDSQAARTVFLGLSVLFVLIVIAIGLALAAVESREDMALLHAVGAGPRTRRGFLAWQAAMVAGLGGALAVLAGYLPSTAVLIARRDDYPLLFPGPQAAALIIGLPIAAAIGTAALSWRSSVRRVAIVIAD
jgi:putative ABC transport system permease protein